PKYFGAVVRAHWGFFRMCRHEPRMAVMDRLNRYIYGNGRVSGSAALENMRTSLPNVEGMFPQSIVYQHFWRGRNIFRYLRRVSSPNYDSMYY
ncbi:MAG: hypothetical protein LUD72_10030, partial [Bacteroidales bacterium]|nr:hypothetical protein [Bacteroidales bacterium]